MRHGRAKAARKTLQYFARTIGLKAPYQLLVDANFVVAIHQQNIFPVEERIEKVLQNSHMDTSAHKHAATKCYMLHSTISELKQLVESLTQQQHPKASSFEQALQWAREHCTILQEEYQSKAVLKDKEAVDEESSSAAAFIWNYISHSKTTTLKQPPSANANANATATPPPATHTTIPYIVASQDEPLLDKLRHLGTVPIIRLANNASVLILEQPSKSSRKQATRQESHKWKHSLHEEEHELVKVVRREAKAVQNQQQKEQQQSSSHQQQQEKQLHGSQQHHLSKTNKNIYEQRKKKKAGGANPLSCKKSRKSDSNNGGSGGGSGSGSSKKRASEKTSAGAGGGGAESSATASRRKRRKKD